MDYCANGLAIKESDISAENFICTGLTHDGKVLESRSITDTDKNRIVSVSLPYRNTEKWDMNEVLDEIKKQLKCKIKDVEKRMEQAEAQKTK